MARERVLVVGAGSISNAWFRAIAEEELEVVGVVDLDVERARAQIHKYQINAEASTDLATVLKKTKADFVLDLTVPEAHCAITCAALKGGCHVVGEKPMASNMEEAREMVRTAENTGRLYMVSQSRRWNDKHRSLQVAVSGGLIGNLTTVNCDFYIGAHFGGFRDEMPSPLIMDMAIHHFDLVRYITGTDPVAVYAKEFNPKGSWYKGAAAATCVFEMTNGVIFTYRGSWCAEGCHTDWNGNWRLIGDKGTLLYEQGRQPHGQIVAGPGGFHSLLHEVQVAEAKVPYPEFRGGLRSMLDYLRTGTVPQTECHDNIKSLAMVFAAIESSRKGMRIPVQVM